MNNDIKSRMRDDIIVQMQQYMELETLQILDNVLVEAFEQVNMEKLETLPAEVRNSVNEKNRYIIELFMYKKSNLAKESMENYLRTVKKFLLHTNKPLTEANDIDVISFLNWFEMKQVRETGKITKGVTVNNERKYLSAFFGWMRKENLIAYNPVETVPLRPEERLSIDFFSQTDVERLRGACKSLRDRAIIETLRSTGARVGEVLRINRFTIDWNSGDVMVKGEKKRNGNAYRLLYLDEVCRYHLQRYLSTRTDIEQCLFIGEKAPHKPLKRAAVLVAMKKIGIRAELECRVYPHKMRKTLGMTLREKGVDIGAIQEVLGHEDPGITAKYYASSTPDSLRNIRKRAA